MKRNNLRELGLSYNHSFYVVWLNMKARCDNPKASGYCNYGARGITYSEAWRNFKGFYEDMYSTWTYGWWLERINNDLEYSKENCKWSSPTENNRNKRSTKLSFEKAEEIRALYATGSWTQKSLGAKFGVSREIINDLLNGRAWQ